MPRSGGGTARQNRDGEVALAEQADGGWIRSFPTDPVEGTEGTTLEDEGRRDPRVAQKSPLSGS